MDIRMKNTISYLRNFTKGLSDYTKDYILTRPVKRKHTGISAVIDASGDLASSISNSETEGKDAFSFSVMGNDYAHSVDKGVMMGSVPNISNLMSWINYKLPAIHLSGASVPKTPPNIERVAYLIATSIGRNGIPATNFLQEIVDENERKLQDTILSENLIKDISMSIGDVLVDLGFEESGDEYEKSM